MFLLSRYAANLEKAMVSVERIKQYEDIRPEGIRFDDECWQIGEGDSRDIETKVNKYERVKKEELLRGSHSTWFLMISEYGQSCAAYSTAESS